MVRLSKKSNIVGDMTGHLLNEASMRELYYWKISEVEITG